MVIDDFDVVRDAAGVTVRRSIAVYASMDDWLIAALTDFIEFD